MEITINGYRINDDDQTIFFTISADGGEYKYHADVPLGLDEQGQVEHLTAHAEAIYCDILLKQYPGAVIELQEGETMVEAWERWISEGAQNRIVERDLEGVETVRYETAEKKPFSGTHSSAGNDVVWITPVPTFEEARQAKAAALRQQTYEYIASYLPDWRMSRWKEYARLREKVLAGESLTASEQPTYDAFPDPGEDHELCYSYVVAAITWANQCVMAHRDAEIALAGMTHPENTIEEINAVVPAYPAWLL